MSEGRCETVSISEGRLTISGSEDGNSLHLVIFFSIEAEKVKTSMTLRLMPKGVKLWLKVRGAVFVAERFFFLDDVIGFEITYILELTTSVSFSLGLVLFPSSCHYEFGIKVGI
ncbi:hypothetical protein RIF29_13650 [Crotalaria pallida]|uniref:Uncharacterized protein n=1 Tax=Crotalaria pallida TaxID=3830 RepID=A0AAN9IPS0_CROPI